MKRIRKIISKLLSIVFWGISTDDLPKKPFNPLVHHALGRIGKYTRHTKGTEYLTTFGKLTIVAVLIVIVTTIVIIAKLFN